MRNLKPLFVAIFTIASFFSIQAQENLNLTAPNLSPAPLAPVENSGSGCFNFKIQNVNNPGYPNAGDTEITIQMDNITPPNGLADLSSDLTPSAYTWSYDAASNSYTGIQSSSIGFLYSEVITVCFDVTANSACPTEDNGFTATGIILNGDDGNTTDNVASSYTCTSEAINLPVELIGFTATKEDKTSLLEWSTATEINNSHFVIERSEDGSRFEEIGIVEGNGTTTALSNYSFVDEAPFSGKNYYRLNQYDFDGKSDLSEIRIVEFTKRGSTISIYPNPVVDFVKITDTEDNARLEVYNMSGKLAYERNIVEGDVIHTHDFSAGTYIFQVVDASGNKLHAEKIIVNK